MGAAIGTAALPKIRTTAVGGVGWGRVHRQASLSKRLWYSGYGRAIITGTKFNLNRIWQLSVSVRQSYCMYGLDRTGQDRTV
jgi:hypothetical protein